MKLDLSSQDKKNAEIEGFQNKALRRILGLKGKEERGDWRKPRNIKLHTS
jgi:hypothetical protein